MGGVVIGARPRPSTAAPTVTVVVPSYWYGRYLREAVRTTYKALAVESLRWAIRAHDLVEDDWRVSMKEHGDVLDSWNAERSITLDQHAGSRAASWNPHRNPYTLN